MLIIRVYGRVQGVGFRYSARGEAHNRGVVGFVHNEDDGSVYIEAQGEAESLKKFLAWCHKGPWLAKVDRVESREVADVQDVDEFSAR